MLSLSISLSLLLGSLMRLSNVTERPVYASTVCVCVCVCVFVYVCWWQCIIASIQLNVIFGCIRNKEACDEFLGVMVHVLLQIHDGHGVSN